MFIDVSPFPKRVFQTSGKSLARIIVTNKPTIAITAKLAVRLDRPSRHPNLYQPHLADIHRLRRLRPIRQHIRELQILDVVSQDLRPSAPDRPHQFRMIRISPVQLIPHPRHRRDHRIIHVKCPAQRLSSEDLVFLGEPIDGCYGMKFTSIEIFNVQEPSHAKSRAIDHTLLLIRSFIMVQGRVMISEIAVDDH